MKKLTWEDVEKVADELAGKIKSSGFQPDCIIGITTGGLIPLYFVAKKLGDVDDIYTATADSYDKDRNKNLRILHIPEVDLTGKKVLLVDDIAESGDSLKGVAEAIRKKCKPADLKVAALGVNTDKAQFYPDFYVVEEKGEWVVFPWEKDDFPEYS